MEPKTVSSTRYETSQVMMPNDANFLGKVFGGAILSMIDLAALNKIKVVLCAILPTTSYSWQPSVKDGTVRVIALNQ